jgi:hypothetical protein
LDNRWFQTFKPFNRRAQFKPFKDEEVQGSTYALSL